MTEQLVKELTEIIQGSKQFVLEQAPDLAKQIVLWGRVVEPVELVICIATLVAGIYLFKLTHRKVSAGDWDEVAWVPIGVSGAGAVLFGFVQGICQLESVAKVYLAPKLYLLTYLTHLTKHS